MKKEIVIVDKKSGTLRVTTVDERWYARERRNALTGLPEYEYKPSVSWIAGKYPKGIGYFKWLAEKGWDEAEAIKLDRAQAGSKVHLACDLIARGTDVKFDDKFKNKETGADEELEIEEYEAVISFSNWYKGIASLNPKVLASEFLVWAPRYAGTGDLLIEVDNEDKTGREVWLIDLKTSQSVFDSHSVQVNAYAGLGVDMIYNGEPLDVVPDRLFILQVGYRRNQAKFKLTEIEKNMEKFEVSYRLWQFEHDEDQPLQRDLPLVIKAISQAPGEQDLFGNTVPVEAPIKKLAKRKITK